MKVEMMKKFGIKGILIALVIVSLLMWGLAWAVTQYNKTPGYKVRKIKRTTITETVEASGTINPVTTVNIGSQVSGMISAIYVDFNSEVKKGQLLAQIDPSLFQAQVEKAQGDLNSAKANYEKIKAMLIYDKKNYERYKKLYTKRYVAKSDLELAEATYKSDVAQLDAMSAQIAQANATLQNNLTNLKYTKIISPVDGVVVSRDVDVGQTVAASFQTPTLFMVAQDLTKMQIEVNVSEADIGRVAVGQDVDYTLDGYADMIFSGKVSQVRISPTTVNNVVTYNVIVEVDNEDEKLKPGMTANVSIITNQKDNALCVPNDALRFTPTEITGGQKYKEQGIWVMRDKKPVRVTIKTGAKNNDITEIISKDIKENERVIIGYRNADKNTGNTQRKRPMRMF